MILSVDFIIDAEQGQTILSIHLSHTSFVKNQYVVHLHSTQKESNEKMT